MTKIKLQQTQALSTARQRPETHLRKVLDCTRGIIFLGTPHHGSGLTHWAEKLAQAIGLVKQTNQQILAVLERDSEVLARIQDSFHVMIRSRAQDKLPPIEITCFFEELPLPVVGIVSLVVRALPSVNSPYFRSFRPTLPSYLVTYQLEYEAIIWI